MRLSTASASPRRARCSSTSPIARSWNGWWPNWANDQPTARHAISGSGRAGRSLTGLIHQFPKPGQLRRRGRRRRSLSRAGTLSRKTSGLAAPLIATRLC
ncbi:hypothetical protein C5U48_04485 [Mycolicibacter virginiensis]|uniref:Uncharacterized protein n=1 Tax=Mycolicibacter virginiensis TaxID=1795032 RepID=A0A9X7IQL5_9MYCO|nr:hypothetical protein C5U48_04485 [Mycolicibacter virginiensis]